MSSTRRFRRSDDGAQQRARRSHCDGCQSVKRRAKHLVGQLLRAFAFASAPAVKLVAATGFGTQEYLQRGVLPVPLHYYQPVFDPDSTTAWERRHDLPGIDLRLEAQLDLLERLGRYEPECDWPDAPGPGYYATNGSFGYASASLLHTMLRELEPARVVEVGSGMSTLITLAALDRNASGELTAIDPNPREQVHDLPERCTVIAEPVERAPLTTFERLGKNDLLFIDSSHVVRTGGDVNYLYLDVLPRLRPGVVVHIHDIQLPYEYPRSYAPRYFWTEQYMLQAMLAHNPRWQILLMGHMLQREQEDAYLRAFPRAAQYRTGTSFYMRVA